MKARIPKGMGGGGRDMNSMIKQAQKMQEEMEKAQAILDEKEFVASVGGGMVELTMTGNKRVKDIVLKPEVVDPDDTEMLTDLVTAAFNQALDEIEKETEERMNDASGGFNVPGVF